MDEAKLDQWQDETTEIPVSKTYIKLDEAGNPIGVETKEEKVKLTQRVIYTKMKGLDICPPEKHYFVFYNNGKREGGHIHVKCRNCPLGKIFLVGKHELINGKLIEKQFPQAQQV